MRRRTSGESPTLVIKRGILELGSSRENTGGVRFGARSFAILRPHDPESRTTRAAAQGHSRAFRNTKSNGAWFRTSIARTSDAMLSCILRNSTWNAATAGGPSPSDEAD